MDSKELAAKITEILDSKKGIDIETIDLTGKTVLADYFVLASGNSTTQIKSLADEVEFVLKKDRTLWSLPHDKDQFTGFLDRNCRSPRDECVRKTVGDLAER